MKCSKQIRKLEIISLALVTSLSFILTSCSGSSKTSESIVSQGISVNSTTATYPYGTNYLNSNSGYLANASGGSSTVKSIAQTTAPDSDDEDEDSYDYDNDNDDYEDDYEEEAEYDSESDYDYDDDDSYDYDYDYDDYEDDYDDDDSGYTDTLVWIPKTGHKYHSYEGCSNMKNPSCVSLEEAIDRGYTQCSKCW